MSAPLRRNRAGQAPKNAPRSMRRSKPVKPGDIQAPRFIGDRAMIELRQRLARDVEAVPQPLDLDPGLPVDRLALRVCAVVAVAALAAWGVVSYSRPRPPTDETRQTRVVTAIAGTKAKLAHVHAAVAAQPGAAPIETSAAAHVLFAAEESAPARASAVSPAPQQPLQPSAVLVPVKAPEPASPAASSAAAASKPALTPDEIATLVKRGRAFLTDGDIAAARLLLQRAAEAGSAEAALALGASFDPLIIKKAGAIGVQTDAALARQWYQNAAALGSDAASKQLANLASNGQ